MRQQNPTKDIVFFGTIHLNQDQQTKSKTCLISIVGIRSRAIEGANNAVNRFVADFQPEAWEQGEDLQQELYKLSTEVYGIVWQQSLEN